MYVKPKKRLGQVFLVNPDIRRKIIEATEFKSSDTVLEIGPGKGELTRKLASLVKSLIAVEIDQKLYSFLKDSFKDCKKVLIINQDILKFDIHTYFKKEKIKIIGNIPYYISTDIIEYLLSNINYIDTAYLMLQKEFAQRIAAEARDKNRGSLSCFVQYYAQPKIIFFVKKGSFYPVPKVDSAFMQLKIRNRPAVELKNEELFFKIIRTSFMQRRKTLRKSLSRLVPQEKLECFFQSFNIDPNIRPQDMRLEDFARLSNSLA